MLGGGGREEVRAMLRGTCRKFIGMIEVSVCGKATMEQACLFVAMLLAC